jgi:hypothetical protein
MSDITPAAAAPSMPPVLPPAGYYPDPHGQSRWWDGQQWTTYLEPPPVAPPAYPPPAYPPQGYPQQGYPAASGPGGANTSLTQQVETFVGNHKQGLTMLAGSVLAADGIVGLPRIGRQRSGIFGSIVGVVVGLVMALIGLGFHMSMAHADATQTAMVTGDISFLNQSSSNSGTTCSPTVTYVVNGQGYRVQAMTGDSGNCSLVIGSPMQVAYDPANPAAAHLPSESGRNSLILLGVGVVGLLLAIACLFQAVFKGAEIAGGTALLVRGFRRRT